MKIGLVDPENLSEKFILKEETTGCTPLTCLKSRVTGPYLHTISASDENLLKTGQVDPEISLLKCLFKKRN